MERTFRQIREVTNSNNILVACTKAQASSVRNQLGDNVSILLEPDRRGTFPIISLASSYLSDVKGLDPEEVVIVCPVDPYVDIEYYEALKELEAVAAAGTSNLVLMGMEPTYPSEKYGYILPASGPMSRNRTK